MCAYVREREQKRKRENERDNPGHVNHKKEKKMEAIKKIGPYHLSLMEIDIVAQFTSVWGFLNFYLC